MRNILITKLCEAQKIVCHNKSLGRAQLVLGGEIEHYLSLGCDHGRLED